MSKKSNNENLNTLSDSNIAGNQELEQQKSQTTEGNIKDLGKDKTTNKKQNLDISNDSESIKIAAEDKQLAAANIAAIISTYSCLSNAELLKEVVKEQKSVNQNISDSKEENISNEDVQAFFRLQLITSLSRIANNNNLSNSQADNVLQNIKQISEGLYGYSLPANVTEALHELQEEEKKNNKALSILGYAAMTDNYSMLQGPRFNSKEENIAADFFAVSSTMLDPLGLCSMLGAEAYENFSTKLLEEVSGTDKPEEQLDLMQKLHGALKSITASNDTKEGVEAALRKKNVTTENIARVINVLDKQKEAIENTGKSSFSYGDGLENIAIHCLAKAINIEAQNQSENQSFGQFFSSLKKDGLGDVKDLSNLQHKEKMIKLIQVIKQTRSSHKYRDAVTSEKNNQKGGLFI